MDNKILLECDCGCSILSIEKVFEDDDYISISHFYSSFYTHQSSCLDLLKRKIKLIWSVIWNKDFCFYEVVLQKEDLKKFKEIVSKI